MENNVFDASELIEEIGKNLQEAFRKSLSFLKKFWRIPGAGNACSIYIFILYWAYEQKTNSVYCTNTFIKEGLQIGDDYLRKGVKVLEELSMIERIIKRNEKGMITGKYIKLKKLNQPIINEKLKESQKNPEKTIHNGVFPQMGFPTDGKTVTNAYKDINKKKKEYTYKDVKETRFKNREHLKEELLKKRLNKLCNKVVITKSDTFDFFRLMRLNYGFSVNGLYPTAEDLRYAGFIAKKVVNPLVYIERAVSNWDHLRGQVVYEDSKKSKLPMYPDMKNLWLSREAILFSLGTVIEKKETVKYTSIDELPKDIPNREIFENVIKTMGYVEI